VRESLCHKPKIAVSRPDDVNVSFFNLPNPFKPKLAVRFTQLEQKMSATRRQIFMWGTAWPLREADKFTAICEQTV
jgi:hypothetical protein